MPCDTIYETSEMDLAKLDRNVLAEALKGAGWIVDVSLDKDYPCFYATVGATRLMLKQGSVATITSPDPDRAKKEILQAYGKLAAKQTAKRFGFSELSSKVQADGSVKITFNRLR
jgi:hypothetical protein